MRFIDMRRACTLVIASVAIVVGVDRMAQTAEAEQGAPAADALAGQLAASVAELRHVVGRWNVVTDFLRDDGTVAATVGGTYEFDWVIEDKVVRGLSEVPSMKQRAAILFFVNDRERTVEMTSVGADGQLWRMVGPLGGDQRTTPDVGMPDGSTLRLRFTRSKVTANGFESRMERSVDGGRQWVAGNHQVFTRITAASRGGA